MPLCRIYQSNFGRQLAVIITICAGTGITASLATAHVPDQTNNKSIFDYQFTVTGLEGDLLKNVTQRLTIEQKTFSKHLSQDDVEMIHSHAKQVIANALKPFGYFKPIIHSTLHQQNNHYYDEFTVTKGPAIPITSADIKILGPGKNDKKLKALIEQFPLKSKKTFQALTYEQAKNKLLETANDQGYIKAHFSVSKVIVDLKHYEVKIILHLETEHRYFVGNMVYHDNDAYDTRFLERFTKNRVDKPFSSEKLSTLQQDLSNSYYFREAAVTPDFDHIEDYRVPINVNLVPPKSQHYAFGIGYGTVTGPRFTSSIDLRRLSATGHHFETQVKLSQVLSGVAAKYYIPGRNPITDTWIFSGNYQKFTPQNGVSYSKTLSAGYSNQWKKFRNNVSLNLLLENFRVDNQNPDELSNRSSQLFYPKMNVYYVNADDLINPHRGIAIDLMLQGAQRGLISTASFLQTELKGKYILGLSDSNRFIFRGDLGYTIVKDIDALPLSMRFFVGGLNTLRGYKDSYVGPGRYLKAFSIEYQQRIIGPWNGALFYDAGTAANHFDAPFKNSQGAGIIYESLMGPIKLYLAHAGDSHTKAYSVELSIGPEF